MSQADLPKTKADAIASLNKTIDKLESIISQLDAVSSDQLPDMTAFANLVSSTNDLATSLEAKPEPEPAPQIEVTPPTLEARITTPPEITPTEAVSEPEPPEQTRLTDRFLPSFSTVQRLWDGLLSNTRKLLPTSINEKLSDWGLTAFLTGAIVLILWLGVLLLPPRTTEIAQVSQSELETPIETPPELTAPKQPETIPDIPRPKPKLTPEQSLIAAIQNQVGEITNQYAEGLIDSIEANFIDSRLIITVSPEWYSLKSSQQDKLANEMFSRSQKLDFSKLEIIDPEGVLLARNPVVGNEMVILKR